MKKNLQHKKNNLLIVIGILLVSPSVFSQSIENLYVKMPDILNPTISGENRLELLEYHKVHQSDSVANRFGNQAHLIKMDTLNQRIIVKNTANSTFEMKLNLQEDSVPYIGIIRTVCAPVCLSAIEFYDTAWNIIPMQFTMPKAIEWVNLNVIPADKIDLDWLKNLLEISFISLDFSAENNRITATNNTLAFLSETDRKLIQPYVADHVISYTLKGRTWVREL